MYLHYDSSERDRVGERKGRCCQCSCQDHSLLPLVSLINLQYYSSTISSCPLATLFFFFEKHWDSSFENRTCGRSGHHIANFWWQKIVEYHHVDCTFMVFLFKFILIALCSPFSNSFKNNIRKSQLRTKWTWGLKERKWHTTIFVIFKQAYLITEKNLDAHVIRIILF